MDVVPVSRFHAMVGALSLAVPASVLDWSHKYAEVMARFGLEVNVIDYKVLEGADGDGKRARFVEAGYLDDQLHAGPFWRGEAIRSVLKCPDYVIPGEASIEGDTIP